MKPPIVTPFSAKDHLDTPERMAAFLNAAAAEDDPAFMIKALGIAARAHGMTDVAQQTGKSRENLYRALSETGNPEATTMLGVIKALGLRMEVAPIGSPLHHRRRAGSAPTTDKPGEKTRPASKKPIRSKANLPADLSAGPSRAAKSVKAVPHSPAKVA